MRFRTREEAQLHELRHGQTYLQALELEPELFEQVVIALDDADFAQVAARLRQAGATEVQVQRLGQLRRGDHHV